MNYSFLNEVRIPNQYPYKYSICTLVSKKEEYYEMVDSFIKGGFDTSVCEYLYIDNSTTNYLDAFKGLNLFLDQAKGEYIIICHQDVVLKNDTIDTLDSRIDELNVSDPTWGILSNAGGVNLKYVAMNLIRGSGEVLKEENLPIRLKTVDENFMLIKRSANLSLSSDLSGFHLYGTDLCILADILGFSIYAVDFKVIHKSDGKSDETFYSVLKKLKQKYRNALRPRFMSTTITRFYLTGSPAGYILLNTSLMLWIIRQYYKIFKPKTKYALKTKI